MKTIAFGRKSHRDRLNPGRSKFRLLAFVSVASVYLVALIQPSTQAICYSCLDLFLLLDDSSSITTTNWNTLLNFACGQVVSNLNISSTGVRVGIIRYGTDAQVIFGLTTYSTASAITSACNAISFIGGSTNLQDALVRALQQFQSDRRTGCSQGLIIISDGRSNDPNASTTQANFVKSFGIKIVGLAVVPSTTSPGFIELQQVATNPDEVAHLWVPDYASLQTKLDLLLQYTCVYPAVQSSSTTSSSTTSSSTTSSSTTTTVRTLSSISFSSTSSTSWSSVASSSTISTLIPIPSISSPDDSIVFGSPSSSTIVFDLTTVVSSPQTPETESPRPVLSTGAAAGIAIGIACFLIIIIVIIILILRKKRSKKMDSYERPIQSSNEPDNQNTYQPLQDKCLRNSLIGNQSQKERNDLTNKPANAYENKIFSSDGVSAEDAIDSNNSEISLRDLNENVSNNHYESLRRDTNTQDNCYNQIGEERPYQSLNLS